MPLTIKQMVDIDIKNSYMKDTYFPCQKPSNHPPITLAQASLLNTGELMGFYKGTAVRN